VTFARRLICHLVLTASGYSESASKPNAHGRKLGQWPITVDVGPPARIYSLCAKKFAQIRNHFPADTVEALVTMAKLTTVDLTRRESQIMEILYRRRRATVEEIRAELPDASSASSVRKLLDIMIERGLLAREYEGPRYVYFPAVKPEDASRSALKQLLRTFFNNSPGSAIAALLDIRSTQLSAAEYRQLSNLLKRAREQGEER
jgi:predicted transcriptional regulator